MIRDIIERLRLPFRDEKELRQQLRQVIGFYPNNISHYKLALTHKSSGQRNEKGRPLHNERLEFLGDAMLDATVGHIVFEHFDRKPEGFLTNTRSKLVSRESLGKLANEMGLTELIQSNGQQRSHNSYMAGNAFEALVGAIYLDQGYDAVMRFLKKRILAKMVNIDKVAYKEVNFKSKLLEWTQKNRVKMDYQMLKQTTDEKGSPVFGYMVRIEGVEGGKGQGFSKKEAQQVASKETLQRLRREPKFIHDIFQAKSDRTKMEEEPTAVPPDLEGTWEKESTQDLSETSGSGNSGNSSDSSNSRSSSDSRSSSNSRISSNSSNSSNSSKPSESQVDEFDLSDITHNPVEKSREDIIAAAEAAAFSE